MAFFIMLSAVFAILLLILHSMIARRSRKMSALFSALIFTAILIAGLTGNLTLIGLSYLQGTTLFLICGLGYISAILEAILTVKNKRLAIMHRVWLFLKLRILPLVQALETRLGKSLFGLVVSLLVTFFFTLFGKTLFQSIEFGLLDLRNELRYTQLGKQKLGKGIDLSSRNIGKSPDISIIKMDSISFATKGYGQMPWKRSSYTIPIDHFSKGQLTVNLSWLNSPGGGLFRIYSSDKPIQSATDIQNSKPVREVRGMPHQTFITHMVFKPGQHYFAITEVLADGSENRIIVPGENSTRFPVRIHIKPALKNDALVWKRVFDRSKRGEKTARKRAVVMKTAGIRGLQAIKPYPKAFFYDVFFLDRKSTVFRTPGGELFDPFLAYDKKLIESFGKNDGIFLDYITTFGEQPRYVDFKQRMEALKRFSLPNRSRHKKKKIEGLYVSSVEPPFLGLIQAVDGTGFARPALDTDDKVRNLPLISHYPGSDDFQPSVVLILAMRYFNVSAQDVDIQLGKYVRLRNAEVPVRNKEGSITGYVKEQIDIPIDERGYMRINFAGPAETFVDFEGSASSFAYFTNYAPDTLNNKIFMIGLYDEGIVSRDRTTDFRKTPLGEMFGVEIMANSLNTILTRNFLYMAPPWVNILGLFLISGLMGLLLPRLSILKGALLLVLVFVGIILGGYFLYESSYIITMAVPIFNVLGIFMALAVYKSLSEETEKRHIRDLFGKMANEEVVDEMLKSPDQLKLGGERREMTVLFSDIRGFTTISESINNPEELVQLLNEYLNAMTMIVKKHQGILDKYVGDEIMAFWGAPLIITPEEQAYLSCLTAVEMMETLHQLNSQWPENKQLDIGIGINTGPMLVGYMGSESRMDYTVIGDSVNLGARLEGANKYYRTHIILNEDTHALLQNRIYSRELDLVRVKGKKLPVTIYELVGIKQ